MPRNDGSDVVFVLGSGASMLQLTDEERAYLNTQTCVAMNKYLLFWEVLRVFPTHFFLADIHYPALRVYEESVAAAAAGPRPIHFLLDQTFRKRYGTGPLKHLSNLYFRSKQIRKHGYHYDASVVAEPATYFKRVHKWDAPQEWGESLDDLMYFYRGSLSVLINLLTVLDLGKHIKLIGVDLKSHGSFFDDAIQAKPYLLDDYMKMQKSGQVKKHMTAEQFQGMPGIQSKWPFIQSNVEQRGFQLSCCNPESLLVEEGLCPYATVLPES